MHTLVIEGWRFIPHSYAMVCQQFALSLAQRRDVRLFFRDMPFVARAPESDNLWPPEQNAVLRGLAPPPAAVDAVLRFDWPHRFAPDPGGARTFVWGTTEFKMVEPPSIASGRPPREELSALATTIIACSSWARIGFVNAGAPADRVQVVPCGADVEVFRPLPPEERERLRQELGWADRFVLLNVSAMTGNKGIPLLLRAAAQASAKFPQVLLALKGVDSMYRSGSVLQGWIGALAPAEQNRLRERMRYVGETLPTPRVAQLMQAADAYVSPYHGEGFNLPALEAAACGLPVICTRGGPTDDFVSDEFALRINSYEMISGGRASLMPNPLHLSDLVQRVVTDAPFRARAAAAGPAWVRERSTWAHAADKLLRVLFPK
jgi:glycosyltransferase involved in cell wall biosynthesis